MFGKPNEGMHRYRIMGLAAVDIGASIILAVVVADFMNISLLQAVLLVTVAGIGLHRLFCVDTALNVKLFGPTRPIQ
jgi:hypothetical protein